MKEQLITFETAKLAKEKVLRIGSLNYYNGNDDLVTINKNYSTDHHHKNNNMQRFRYEAPTQSLLQKWLREEHDLFVSVDKYEDKADSYFISTNCIGIYGEFKTYESALENGLLEALKLINL